MERVSEQLPVSPLAIVYWSTMGKVGITLLESQPCTGNRTIGNFLLTACKLTHIKPINHGFSPAPYQDSFTREADGNPDPSTGNNQRLLGTWTATSRPT